MRREKTWLMLFLIIILSIAIYMLFFHLGQSPLQPWDESRHGATALEMLKHHRYIINTYEGKNDYWNLKPPLSFWAIALSVWIFGKSIFSIRLASALSSSALFIVIAWFMRSRYGIHSAIISLILIISCQELFIFHGFRSADADAMYLFCMVTGTLLTLPPSSTLKLTLAAFLGALAFLLKSWHGLCLGIPFLFFYGWAIYQKSFKFQEIYYPAIAFITPILLWGVLRYSADGWLFFQQAWHTDLIHSISNTDKITEPLNNINLSQRTAFYYCLLLIWQYLPLNFSILLFLYFSISKTGMRKTLSFDILMIFFTACLALLLYSLSTSRHQWYMYYSVILWCITSGALASKICKRLNPYFIPFAILALSAFFLNYVTIIKSRPSDFYNQQLSTLSKTHSFDYLIMSDWPKSMSIFKPYHSEYAQSEYLAVLIFTPFTINTIQSSFTGGHALLMKRKSETTLPPPQCHRISVGDEFDFYECLEKPTQKA
jgi:4-amino-4-deoxy-L-arabinose transferase-like glycosyltransferase